MNTSHVHVHGSHDTYKQTPGTSNVIFIVVEKYYVREQDIHMQVTSATSEHSTK